MSHLTLNDLKAALVSLGIPLPSTDNEKKYFELYKKHVSPLKNIEMRKTHKYNQFSSDDEDVSSTKHVYTNKKVVARMSGKTLTQSEILSLSDDQLYNELLQFNLTAGPIVDSTRKIYQRKLIKLMGGDVVDSSFNGEVDDDEYSDSDSEGKVTKSTYSAAQSPSSSTVRSRVTTGSPASSLDNSLAFDHDRHTPSPRPSLRTASSSTTTTSTKYTGAGKTFRETTSLRHTYTYPSQMEQSPDATSSYLGRLLVKCIFILILLTALYFTYQYMYSESPLKGLKNLAQQASDLANGNTKKESKVKSKP